MYPVNIIENLNMLDTRMVIPFRPTDIIGLQLWLDAADATTLFQDAAKTTAAGNGDVVGAWSDKSGNGLDVTQATTANKPTARFNSQNGLATVEFDGTDDRLDNSTLPAQAQPHTFIAVSFLDAAAAGTRVLIDSEDSPEVALFYNNKLSSVFGGAALTGSIDVSGAYHILTGIVDNPNSLIRTDGADENTGVTGANAFTPVRIGNAPGLAGPFDGRIAEILWYNRRLSATEYTQIETYLSNKWGIALS